MVGGAFTAFVITLSFEAGVVGCLCGRHGQGRD
jgi:hypothetical protein